MPTAVGPRSDAEWWLNMCLCAVFAAGYVILGSVTIWGPPRLHQTESMDLVGGLGVPWAVWGALCITAGVLLVTRWTRVGGFFLGATIIAFYVVSYLVSILGGGRGAGIGIFCGLVAFLSQVSGAIRSMIAAEWRRR